MAQPVVLIGPHIEMGTLCDGSLGIAARYHLTVHVYVPFYRNYINQSSFVEAVLAVVVAVQNESPKADTDIGTF
jgi:hypothetical protein